MFDPVSMFFGSIKKIYGGFWVSKSEKNWYIKIMKNVNISHFQVSTLNKTALLDYLV